ncbi:MAG: hypothetical protein RBT63_07030, partial [Bdellovibrionales bacterium]|nr:hypothetical protein [Bdellovibrionales bacterium]
MIRGPSVTQGLLASTSLLITVSLAVPPEASASEPLFRSRSGNFSEGTMRTVTVSPPGGWKEVASVNRDPLSMAQWTPVKPMCSTGAASRISLYNVDVGQTGAQRLIQSWFPSASRFQVVEQERGFILVKAESDDQTVQAVIAYPLSDQHITPLAGWIGGVKVLFVAESSTQTAAELEALLRSMIRNQAAVKAKSPRSIDTPFVLFGKRWHKSLANRIDGDLKRQPAAMLSKAYTLFSEADGYVPAGQQLLNRAAQAGSLAAKTDLIRLSRRSLLTVPIEGDVLKQWTQELADAGSEDAQFWLTGERPFDEVDENIPGLESLRKLASCGHPEAKRVWAKHQVQSFEARDRRNGRHAVLSLMQSPPVRDLNWRDLNKPFTARLTTRVPETAAAPEIEELKAAAILKTACPEEGDPDEALFAGAADFKVAKMTSSSTARTPQRRSVATTKTAGGDDFPELNEARELDRLANAGN